MAFGMAVGIIFSFMTPGYQADLSTYLFGNILLSNKENIIMLLLLDITIIIVFFIFYKSIIYSSFDENFYNIYGVPVKFINYLLIILISSAIIINIKTIGIILIISILTIPQATASLLVKKYYLIIIFSGIFSFLGILSGLYFSYSLNIPSGPAIILSLTIILLFTKGFRKIFKKTAWQKFIRVVLY